MKTPLRADPLDPHLVGALVGAGAYPHDPGARAGVEHVQTHLSHVFLTRGRVYKLRKDVSLGFVDFATRAARLADCAREVALNRRLAPDVYLGLAAVEPAGAGYAVGPVRERVELGAGAEPCVVMRRLPAGRDALSLLEAGRLEPARLDAVAERIARLHRAHRLPPSDAPDGALLARICDPVEDNFRALQAAGGGVVERGAVSRAARRARAFAAECGDALVERLRAGRAVDGHGDLHLQHVWFETGAAEPLIIDCLEFNTDLRQVDAACDIGFLAMDLRYRRRADLAARVLRRYAAAADDFGLFPVVDFYVAYRAAVRAKVAAIAAGECEVDPAQRRAAAGSARRHLALAARALERRSRPALVVMCGVVGTGKSSVADLVAAALGGAVIASDRVRKLDAGLDPGARAGAGTDTGLYAPEVTERTYRGLLERAAPVVASGRAAVLDATFAARRWRAAAATWATRRGVPVLLVETRCARSTCLERLARRAAEARDPSDAGPDFYATSVRRFEPPDEWPPERRLVVDTTGAWRRRTRAALRATGVMAPELE